jgi:hypothetical protein
MSWSDPIVDEVRRVRDAYAARFNYDLRAIFRDLKEKEKRSGRKLVSYASDASNSESEQSSKSIELATIASCTPTAEQIGLEASN